MHAVRSAVRSRPVLVPFGHGLSVDRTAPRVVLTQIMKLPVMCWPINCLTIVQAMIRSAPCPVIVLDRAVKDLPLAHYSASYSGLRWHSKFSAIVLRRTGEGIRSTGIRSTKDSMPTNAFD